MANILTNKIFLAGILSMLICQLIKMIVLSIKGRRLNLKHFFELSGMPSTHTATSVAISATIYFKEGMSGLFILSLFIVVYIIDEVLWIEEALGLHARIFNKLSETIQLSKIIPKTLRERWGHTYDEIIVGAIIGWFIAFVVDNYL